MKRESIFELIEQTPEEQSSSDDSADHHNIQILNLFDLQLDLQPDLQLINAKPAIKNKLKLVGLKN